MIESKNDTSKNLEKALQALEQAKQRVANEKKKQNEKKRKAENHHKYIMGGIIVKYFPDCYHYDEGELNRILSVALQTRECQQIISKIKAESRETTPPPNAPKEYADRATLWNAVELSEKGQKSQLARMLKASLPTEWSYELAEEIVRDYVQRNFADKGMEQGIDREPTIHIGAVANALERKGIQTERGNINRLAYAEVISYNKKNLERELQNESRQHNRQQGRPERREEEI
nr:MobA/MobL family protein [uncultured Acetatifactor sp.]